MNFSKRFSKVFKRQNDFMQKERSNMVVTLGVQQKLMHRNNMFDLYISCTIDVAQSNVNITRIEVKNQTDGRRTVNDVTLIRPVFCYSI